MFFCLGPLAAALFLQRLLVLFSATASRLWRVRPSREREKSAFRCFAKKFSSAEPPPLAEESNAERCDDDLQVFGPQPRPAEAREKSGLLSAGCRLETHTK